MAPQDRHIGQVIGGYRVVSLIGSGGMADVYLAEEPKLRRQVAIKLLPPENLRDERSRRRFEREVRTIARLQHPRILTVLDEGIHSDGTSFVSIFLLPTHPTLIQERGYFTGARQRKSGLIALGDYSPPAQQWASSM